jgi:hypothetical protein
MRLHDIQKLFVSREYKYIHINMTRKYEVSECRLRFDSNMHDIYKNHLIQKITIILQISVNFLYGYISHLFIFPQSRYYLPPCMPVLGNRCLWRFPIPSTSLVKSGDRAQYARTTLFGNPISSFVKTFEENRRV